MENASKALLFAGTILIAIMVVSLLMLTINRVSEYQSSSTELENASQLAEFNEQFTQYVRDDVKGVELISLLNKVVAYNQKESGPGEIDYTKKITITVNMKDFNQKHAASQLFGPGTNQEYTVNSTNTDTGLMKIIDYQRNTELKYGRHELSLLASNEESLRQYYTAATGPAGDRDRQEGKTLEYVLGKKIANNSNLKELENELKNKNFDIIDKEAEYSNFKTSTFQCSGEPDYHGNGQVKSLSFEFVK